MELPSCVQNQAVGASRIYYADQVEQAVIYSEAALSKIRPNAVYRSACASAILVVPLYQGRSVESAL